MEAVSLDGGVAGFIVYTDDFRVAAWASGGSRRVFEKSEGGQAGGGSGGGAGGGGGGGGASSGGD